jgi:hypothetical protein
MVKNNLQNKYSLNIFLNQYFNALVVVLMIVIFVAAYFLLLGPKFASTQAVIKDNIEAQKKLYAEQDKKLKDLKTVKEIYDKITPVDLKRFNGVLPEEYVREQLFGEFEEIIIDNGFLINAVTIAPAEEEKIPGSEPAPSASEKAEMPTIGGTAVSERVGRVVATVSIGAIDYSGFKSLLRTLEANSRLLDIESVTFSQGENSAQLLLAAYFYKPVKQYEK